ncbi:hypothetical protein RF11_04882 [Thelohanellus kitauei]|uniref:Uncharacterized protein n=1 Tax=Thelohanellus kitauei TaxID=669202 RepID=A0A0C2NH13_THEKT|nr:hypothetical protein RF11_04882 [Thelohanellus kitauei]
MLDGLARGCNRRSATIRPDFGQGMAPARSTGCKLCLELNETHEASYAVETPAVQPPWPSTRAWELNDCVDKCNQHLTIWGQKVENGGSRTFPEVKVATKFLKAKRYGKLRKLKSRYNVRSTALWLA